MPVSVYAPKQQWKQTQENNFFPVSFCIDLTEWHKSKSKGLAVDISQSG